MGSCDCHVTVHAGLVEIDVLQQLEEVTGKSIPELFDWIVATSTGAIIILGMLYGQSDSIGDC